MEVIELSSDDDDLYDSAPKKAKRQKLGIEQTQTVKKCNFVGNDLYTEDINSSDSDYDEDIKNEPDIKPVHKINYHDDDFTLPYYQRGAIEPFRTQDVAEILLFKDDVKQCSNVPLKVMENASFVVDIDKLVRVDDIKADDLGAWTHVGSPSSYIEVHIDDDGELLNISSTRKYKPDAYRLVTKQYKHSDLRSNYRKRISFLYNTSGNMHRLAFLQYFFSDGIVKEINIPKHGNSKNSESYTRTRPSKLQEMKEYTKEGMTPKDAFFKACEKEGGVQEARSISSLPRNTKQLDNCKSSQKRLFSASDVHQRDTLLEAMEACKEKSSIAKETIGAPEPMTFLANDRQLKDLELYCLGEGDVSILGVDPTFNLGDFFVTFTTYRALKIANVSTGKPPVFLGPALIHRSKEQKTYAYLASSITRHNPKLTKLKAFGTDGEKALQEAFKQYFTSATHLRCFIHMRRNIISKLTDLGIRGKDQTQFINDIFGHKREQIQYDGLAHASGCEEFLVQLESLEHQWSEAELNLTGKEPKFFDWFVINISDNMQETMLTDKRCVGGPDMEASLYSTNDNESINAMIKNKVKFQKSNLIDFINVVDKVVHEQDVILENSICGFGDYRLTDNYKYLELPQDKWRKMTPAQRRQYLTSAKAKGICPKESTGLSVKADSTGITSIPKAILENTFKKASALLKDKKVMLGFKEDTMLVQSETLDRPHVVHVKANGRYDCDKDCPAYKHSSLCSHTLAAAEFKGRLQPFIAWYKGSSKGTNASRLANHGFDRVGKKPGQRVRKRTKENNGSPLTMRIAKTPGGTYSVHKLSDATNLDSFDLVFLGDHPRVKTCTGCKQKFARHEDNQPFAPPHDLAVSHKESRPFVDKNSGNLRTGRLQSAYFHTNIECIRKGYGKSNSKFCRGDLCISQGIEEKLGFTHREHLQAQGLL